MNFAEQVVEGAATAFKQEFEAELRQRLLDVATAEIEHIVSEVSRKMQTSLHLCRDVRMNEITLNIKVSP